MPGKVTVWVKPLGGEPLPARESSAAGGPSAARMRQAASKKDDLMEIIADLGLVVWYFTGALSCAPSFPCPPLSSAVCL